MTAENAVAIVAGAAAILQLGAAFYSVRLISATGAAAGPAALGVAFALMSTRRIASFSMAAVGAETGPWLLPYEVIGLAASALMLLAVRSLGEVFLARRRAEQRLQESYDQLHRSAARERALAEQCIRAQEQERRLLSYELHDGLAQYVVAAQMHLDTYMAYLDRDTQRADYQLGAISGRLASAVTEVRRLVSELRVSVLEDLGLGAAVREHLLALAEHHGWEWEFRSGLSDARLHSTLETMAFRIVQEALTNVAKHAQAERVAVALDRDGDRFVAEVRDWGRGFRVGEALADTGKLGLTAMRGRAGLVHGDCTIASRPGQGTTVRLVAPLREREQEA
jgi:signal transduction histidine kinase